MSPISSPGLRSRHHWEEQNLAQWAAEKSVQHWWDIQGSILWGDSRGHNQVNIKPQNLGGARGSCWQRNMFQIKEEDKTSEKEVNEVEISSLPIKSSR